MTFKLHKSLLTTRENFSEIPIYATNSKKIPQNMINS